MILDVYIIEFAENVANDFCFQFSAADMSQEV